MHHIFYIFSLVYKHVGCFYLSATVTNAAGKLVYKYLFETLFSII